MTTFAFAPPVNGLYSFQPSFDGAQYLVSVPWPIGGQRWYLNCQQLNGTPVFYEPLLGSTDGINIQGLAWLFGEATATTAAPHGYPVGSTVNLTIANAVPDAWNGTYTAFITGPSTFDFDMASNPGSATSFGAVSYDINLLDGYFTTSRMVFRQSLQTFIVTP